ncbi:hypothetical protein C2G38_2183505 [Gigaspora rosea]|uniref:Uncharacterized protein n=1 Tax=Gigaspora rosea TaxID=44941 RepID=A0A397VD25_9GLOM|nr:hypothetical protein C2G38_2183505 [Gigaspora rosea]
MTYEEAKNSTLIVEVKDDQKSIQANEGVEKDDKAFICCQQSVEMGNTIEINSLGYNYRNEISVEMNEVMDGEYDK